MNSTSRQVRFFLNTRIQAEYRCRKTGWQGGPMTASSRFISPTDGEFFPSLAPREQNTMGQHHCHAAVLRIQAGKHVQTQSVIAFRSGRHTPIETMVWVPVQRTFSFCLCYPLRPPRGTAVPLVQTKRRICHYHLELHQIIILNVLRIGEGISLPDPGRHPHVQEHIHSAESQVCALSSWP